MYRRGPDPQPNAGTTHSGKATTHRRGRRPLPVASAAGPGTNTYPARTRPIRPRQPDVSTTSDVE